MSLPPPAPSSRASASPSEKMATSPASARSDGPNTTSSAPAPTPKQRSCVVCRSRKVRCDKQSPCSNCRRANIACIFPARDRPPRWARRLDRVTTNAVSQDSDPAAAAQVIERLRNLEGLVKELSGQLEHANANAGSGSSKGNSPESSNDHHQSDASPNTNTGSVQKQFGRLVLQDSNRSRYVSSGFWSRVNDELDGLKMDSRGLGTGDSDTSEDEDEGKPPPTQELDRTPSERHGFLFRHTLNPAVTDLREFHPLPSQVPFLLDVFLENVNTISRIVHEPTITKLVRDLRGRDMASLTPANEALMFSIYYSAITAMEEDDIMTNFGCTKSDLNLKYRVGLEQALAKADFLNVPDLVLLQAFVLFVFLLRRHDSPRFVWMMTALAVRMGQALGLQRDGTHFTHLTPYEIEIRRRVWWALSMIDVRAAEDQGSDYMITSGSFDTKLPLNINDTDIDPGTTQVPTEREGVTDMTFVIVTIESCEAMREIVAQSSKAGIPGIEEQSHLLNETYQRLDRRYLQYAVESDNIAYWVVVTITRLMMAKMTLFIYLPILFSPSSEHFSDEIKDKLLVAAIEIAEYNHALNAEQACRQWRWVFQTYTHWYAVVYLLIEASRRPWSPIVERAWVALHSQWLIPAQSHMDKSMRVWVPLRKLTSKARKHREAEIKRLRWDLQAAERLEMDDQLVHVPASPGPFPSGSNVAELFRKQWRQLLAMPEGPRHDTHTLVQPNPENTSPSAYSTYTTQPSTGSMPAYNAGDLRSNTTFDTTYSNNNRLQTSQHLPSNTSSDFQQDIPAGTPSSFAIGQNAGPSYYDVPAVPESWGAGPSFDPWLWADTDPSVNSFASVDLDAIDANMDLDSDMDWYNWIESAKGVESVARTGGNGLA